MLSIRYKLELLGTLLVALCFVIFSSVFLTLEWSKLKQDILRDGMVFGQANAGAIFGDYYDYYSNPSAGIFELFSKSLNSKLEKMRTS